MNEVERQARNTQKLAECWPSFGEKIQAVLDEMEAAGWRPRIQDAYRSPADQLAAFQSGHSKLRYGFHNCTGNGGVPESLAVDVIDDDHPLASAIPYLLRLAAAAENQGLVTGILWGLPAALQDAVTTAISTEQWEAPVKLGWDPTHIEPMGITVAAAKAGARP